MKRPIEALCAACGKTFPHPIRAQGGGRYSKYCSPACRSRDWARGNSASRKATITKYENRPENKERKAVAARSRYLRKYGWNEADFQTQLVRQKNSCAGCHTPLDDRTARIDHDHTTGRVRGLLCDSCNWGLGHLKDDPAILRRLMAYLDRDISQTMVYLIGALKNQRIPDVGNLLRGEGYDVMDEWFTPGELADVNWQEYERRRGRTYQEALRGRAATNIFLFDRSYLDASDIVVLVMPAGKSAMLELGYAKGRGKKTAIFLDGSDPDRYDIMPNFADKVFMTEADLVAGLRDWR